MTPAGGRGPRPAIEIYLHGLLYIRVERPPRWLIVLLLTTSHAATVWYLTQ